VSGRFVCEACEDDLAHEHGPDCGHFHMPDPAKLGRDFSWREAGATVVAAGLRPCSGAILVLVFAMWQGIFYAGILATLAMSLGTALTTGALAALAVLAKGTALRLTSAGSTRAVIALRALELIAAVLVCALGLGLLLGIAGAGF
jgi:ABC-type nickel/cobalt efflux system permease component RcnA